MDSWKSKGPGDTILLYLIDRVGEKISRRIPCALTNGANASTEECVTGVLGCDHHKDPGSKVLTFYWGNEGSERV